LEKAEAQKVLIKAVCEKNEIQFKVIGELRKCTPNNWSSNLLLTNGYGLGDAHRHHSNYKNIQNRLAVQVQMEARLDE
jgi:hypothetical protein